MSSTFCHLFIGICSRKGINKTILFLSAIDSPNLSERRRICSRKSVHVKQQPWTKEKFKQFSIVFLLLLQGNAIIHCYITNIVPQRRQSLSDSEDNCPRHRKRSMEYFAKRISVFVMRRRNSYYYQIYCTTYCDRRTITFDLNCTLDMLPSGQLVVGHQIPSHNRRSHIASSGRQILWSPGRRRFGEFE